MLDHTAPHERRIPKPRTPGVDLDTPVPRHWFAGNAVLTHVANGVNLLFPAGERFFVRSVNHYLDRVTDPVLRDQIKGFFGQEGRHAKEHERFFRQMEAQGYDIARFLRVYERIAYGFLERVTPPPVRLAATAALEHFTAILAENALSHGLLDHAHPTMRALLLWHAAEEIEHRAVAFDVLQVVAPTYGVRVAGLAIGAACLGGFWVAAAAMLLWQERGLDPDRLAAGARIVADHSRHHPVFLKGIREYLAPGFHPSQKDTDRLAAAYLAGVGLA